MAAIAAATAVTDKAIVLITGGNQGLGYHAVHQLAASGKYHVLMGSRDVQKAEEAIKTILASASLPVDASSIEPIQIDITSDASIKAAVDSVSSKHGRLDVLMNNAGVNTPQKPNEDGSGPTLRELYRLQYETNVFSHGVVTDAFLPLLRRSISPLGKRIEFTSSGLGSLDWAHNSDSQWALKKFPGFGIYRSTKAALNMIMLAYARQLEDEGFVVSACDPGYNATSFNHHSGFKDPTDGAKELVKCVVAPREEVHALFVDENGVAPF